MKNILILLIATFSLFASNTSYSQSITTGQVGENDIYTDFDSDQIISISVEPHADYNEYFYIDVDQNGINDFVVRATGFGTNGGGTGDIFIFGTESQNQILSHQETTAVYPGDNFLTVNVPDTLNEDFEISANSRFVNENSYLMSTYYGPVYDQPYVDTWENNFEYFIGFRIKPSQDTLYGWMRISLSHEQVYTLTIKDLACNINEFANNESDNKFRLSIYPNPATNTLYVNCLSQEDIVQIDIYNISGQISKSLTPSVKTPSIDISELPKGTYIIVLSSKKKVYRERFIKL